MKKIVYVLLVTMAFLLVSCGGSSSSGGADGGVSGWGYYDFFNGHTWSLVVGTVKTSFIFANTKVTRKEFALENGVWVEKYSSTEKPFGNSLFIKATGIEASVALLESGVTVPVSFVA